MTRGRLEVGADLQKPVVGLGHIDADPHSVAVERPHRQRLLRAGLGEAAGELEVAILDHTRPRRAFKRLSDARVAELLG